MKDRIRKKISDVGFSFAWITTLMVFANAVYIAVFYESNLEVDAINYWYILGISLVLSLSTLIFPENCTSRRAYAISIIVHYLIVNAVVLLGGWMFEWFDPASPVMFVGMLVLIGIIYAMVMTVMQIRDKREAELMNGKLQELSDSDDL